MSGRRDRPRRRAAGISSASRRGAMRVRMRSVQPSGRRPDRLTAGRYGSLGGAAPPEAGRGTGCSGRGRSRPSWSRRRGRAVRRWCRRSRRRCRRRAFSDGDRRVDVAHLQLHARRAGILNVRADRPAIDALEVDELEPQAGRRHVHGARRDTAPPFTPNIIEDGLSLSRTSPCHRARACRARPGTAASPSRRPRRSAARGRR